MKLVVDTNKIIACLLKDGKVRWLFFSEFLDVHTPYYTMEEFDIDDWPFIALALKLNIPIWTNDKSMIIYGSKSGKYLALDTQAVEDLLKKSLKKLLVLTNYIRSAHYWVVELSD